MKKNIIDMLKINIDQQLNGDYVAPMVLAGSPGTGKSESIKKLTKDRNMNLLNFSMASISIEQFSG